MSREKEGVLTPREQYYLDGVKAAYRRLIEAAKEADDCGLVVFSEHPDSCFAQEICEGNEITFYRKKE